MQNQENQECVNKLKEIARTWFAPITGREWTIINYVIEDTFINHVIVSDVLPENWPAVIYATIRGNTAIRVMHCGNLDKIIDLVKAVINNNATLNYISHYSIAKILGLTPKKRLCGYKNGDVLLLFTLNKSLRNAVDVQVAASDLDVYLVTPAE